MVLIQQKYKLGHKLYFYFQKRKSTMYKTNHAKTSWLKAGINFILYVSLIL